MAAFTAEEAKAHHATFGIDEGRIATLADTREGFLSEMVFKERGEILEIGPGCAPALDGISISYADLLDASALRARSQARGLDISNCPENIDYPDGLDAIDRTFDTLFSSHVIEYQPDLIGHLRMASRLLVPGGRYYLIVSDKRFSSDALLGESSIADIVQAHRPPRARHAMATAIEQRALATHNDPCRHWASDHGALDETAIRDQIRAAIRTYEDGEDHFIDARAWRFTPARFREILTMLRLLKLIELAPVRIYNTPRDRQEFCAVLEDCASERSA
ncbi:class I SAM-dependent methyltransferase [Sphingobium amiense]|uniref:class I SAM-dependent methyltransferase n=1 Tax=Sphingobium amiense TaxID=135719 RepID=UPI0008332D4A|nr:class I SAM-dependent methyltransferase [Sphingobium amiense]